MRLVARVEGCKHSSVSQARFDEIAETYSTITGDQMVESGAQQAKLQQALNPNLNEMFFTRRLILVEGIEDAAYLASWLVLTDRWDEYRARGCHIVPVGGKDKLIQPLIISNKLGIPSYVMFDADGHVTNADRRKFHERDNGAILKLVDQEKASVFPDKAFWAARVVVWPHEIGRTLKEEAGAEIWDKAFGKARKEIGEPEGDYKKNMLVIGDHLAFLQNEKVRMPTLDSLCDAVLKF